MISRIETEGVSPTVATLDELLFLMHEELVLEMTVDERLKRGLEESQAILDEQWRNAGQ